MLLFQTRKPKITAFDVRAVTNVRKLIPVFNRSKDLRTTFDYNPNWKSFVSNPQVSYDESIPIRLFNTVFNNFQHIEPNKIHVQLSRRISMPLMPCPSQNWEVVEGDIIVIVGIDSYNMGSSIYTVFDNDRKSWESKSIYPGVMLVIENASSIIIPEVFPLHPVIGEAHEDVFIAIFKTQKSD